ncbi:hypothetical protein CsSME_00037560 [Camellia sinensis var. sinensis]
MRNISIAYVLTYENIVYVMSILDTFVRLGQVSCLFFQLLLPRFWLLRSSGHSCARAGFTNFAPPLEQPFLRSSGICQFSAFHLQF